MALAAVLGAYDGHAYRCKCFVGPVLQRGRRQVVARPRPDRCERIQKVGITVRHSNGMIDSLHRLAAPLAKLLSLHPGLCLQTLMVDSELEQAEGIAVDSCGCRTLRHAHIDKSATTARPAA